MVEAVCPVLASLGSVVLMGVVFASQDWIGSELVISAVVLVAVPSDEMGRDGASLAGFVREVLISGALNALPTDLMHCVESGLDGCSLCVDGMVNPCGLGSALRRQNVDCNDVGHQFGSALH